MSLNWWVISGFILTTAGGILMLVGNYRDGEENKALIKEVSAKNSQIAELNNKNTEIVMKESLNIITGGDSYFILTPVYDSSTNLIQLVVHHEGKYPIYDVNISITTQDLDLSKNSWVKPEKKFQQIGTVHKGHSIRFLNEGLNGFEGSNQGRNIFISISARNFTIEHDILFYLPPGTKVPLRAEKIVKFNYAYDNSNVGPIKDIIRLKQEIEVGFPKILISAKLIGKGEGQWQL